MTSYALGITYDGSSFHGWQRQSSVATVQGELEQALSQVANEPISLNVAGRTDAGVHATGQVAAFTSDSARTAEDWRRGANALTPDSIVVNWVVPTPEGFHPRYDAVSRRYVYVFQDVDYADPFLRQRVWQTQKLDADKMHRAARALLGEHDFTSFRGAGCQSMTPIRRVNRVDVMRQGHFVLLDIEANAFVLHMVRNIAAGLHGVGVGQPEETMATLLAAKDRTQLGPTAPPQGLYFRAVSYPGVPLPPAQPLSFVQKV